MALTKQTSPLKQVTAPKTGVALPLSPTTNRAPINYAGTNQQTALTNINERNRAAGASAVGVGRGEGALGTLTREQKMANMSGLQNSTAAQKQSALGQVRDTQWAAANQTQGLKLDANGNPYGNNVGMDTPGLNTTDAYKFGTDPYANQTQQQSSLSDTAGISGLGQRTQFY